MKLSDFLDQQHITQKQFAERLGVHQMHVHGICRGKNRPSADLARRIEELTDGHVTRLELLYPEDKAA